MHIRPEILQHPNIPRPLHGVAPREIKGRKWWDEIRREAYQKNDFKCWACGRHKSDDPFKNWLEAHESYHIDYNLGIVKIDEIVALCHSCHNFIHSGRLRALYKSYRIKQDKAEYIITRGLEILRRYELQPFYSSMVTKLVVCDRMPEDEAMDRVMSGEFDVFVPHSDVAWGDWKLEFEGQFYHSLDKDIHAWAERYDVKINGNEKNV